MDSITQILLGAACTAVVAPASERRKALLLGGLLGTLPDLDVLPLLAVRDPVLFVTWHRSFSHSLLVLPLLGLLLWWLAQRRWGWQGDDRRRWLFAIQLALITHPLLDAHTVYGTQLFWPVPTPPVMWATVFIIDPLYTLPLFAACVLAWRRREQARARHALLLGLALSSGYLGWSWLAKWRVESALAPMLERVGLEHEPLLTVPTPFNTLGWRVVVMREDGYFEGFASALYPDRPLTLRFHEAVPNFAPRFERLPAVRRMQWFTQGFYWIEQRGSAAVLVDLRMGMDPDYFFAFLIGRDSGERWTTVHPPEQLPRPRIERASLGRVARAILQAFEARNAAVEATERAESHRP
jgi:inner membrane protein